MITPLVTAVIPTYKRPQLLKRAVRSVLVQSFPHFEVIIADNASGNETDIVTQELLRQDKRIKLLKHMENIGATANFNSAIEHVTTPYVCFLPDDDFYAPFFFEETLPFFNQYPEIAFCGGGSRLIYENGSVKKISAYGGQTIPPTGYYEKPDGFFTYLRTSHGLAMSALLFKTSVVREIGGFHPEIRNGLDQYLVMQCSARYPVYLITTRPFYFAFMHESNLSSEIDYVLFEREATQLYATMESLPLTKHEKEEIDAFFKKREINILSGAHSYFSARKQFDQAGLWAEKAYARLKTFKWKKKCLAAKIYHHLPALSALEGKLKKYERSLRHQFKPKKAPASQDHSVADAHFWQEYAKSLDS